jgi:hypothetical protein
MDSARGPAIRIQNAIAEVPQGKAMGMAMLTTPKWDFGHALQELVTTTLKAIGAENCGIRLIS